MKAPENTIIIVIIITFFFLSVSYCEYDGNYAECMGPFNCGNLTDLEYPFWSDDVNRSAICGYEEFKLTCEEGQFPIIKTGNQDYRVLSINREKKLMTIARGDLYGTICPDDVANIPNVTLNTTLFSFDSGLENVSLYYNCTTQITTSVPTRFQCPVNGELRDAFYGTDSFLQEWNRLGNITGDCNITVAVPVPVRFTEQLLNGTNEFVSVLEQGFNVNYMYDKLCQRCTDSGGICGTNTTTSYFSCLCRDQPDPVECPQGKDVKFSLPVAVIVVIVVAAVGSWLSIGFFSTRRGRFWVKSMFFGLKKTKQGEKIEAFIMNYQSLIAKRYSYWDVSKMTNAFADKLGQGGFGGVYKGKLLDGRLVAVKVLNKSTGDGEEFINEVAAISRTSHVNIVNLLGFCFERTKRALIYEYMPNGSLDKYINDSNSRHLEWKTLYEIAIGIARGLEYLHRGCNTRIVHFDIKPHNILLDENLCPKIADFGLAKLCKGKESIVSMLGARGTAGYIAPEVFMRDFGGVSYKSDVYSYGMLILEMFAGKDTNRIDFGFSQTSEIYFSDWIYKHLEPGIISRVHENISEEEEETVRRMIIVGLCCIQTNPSDRPSMTKVVEMLEGSLESLQIPPKPLLFSTSDTAPKFSSIASSSLLNLWKTKEEDKALSLAEAD